MSKGNPLSYLKSAGVLIQTGANQRTNDFFAQFRINKKYNQ